MTTQSCKYGIHLRVEKVKTSLPDPVGPIKRILLFSSSTSSSSSSTTTLALPSLLESPAGLTFQIVRTRKEKKKTVYVNTIEEFKLKVKKCVHHMCMKLLKG